MKKGVIAKEMEHKVGLAEFQNAASSPMQLECISSENYDLLSSSRSCNEGPG
jgi:hypothetical protein